MPDPSTISNGLQSGGIYNYVDRKGNVLHFDQTDIYNGRLEQNGWTTETNFWRDEDGNEYVYDYTKAEGRGFDGFAERVEREKGVKLTKAGENERPSNYLEQAYWYAMPDGGKTIVKESDKAAFDKYVKSTFQRDPSKASAYGGEGYEEYGVTPITTRRINGVFMAISDETSAAIDEMARNNGGAITAQMMAEAGFTPEQLAEGQKWMTGKLKQNEEDFKNKYGPMGFREYEEKIRATSMGGDSLGRTYARQALQQMPKSIGVKSFDEQVRDYGADNGLQLLKDRTWIGKAIDAIGYGGLAHKETWDWMFMSDEEQYEVFKTLNEELKRNEYEAEVRGKTWQASVGSGAIDMGLYALDMMPAAVFSTATGTGLKGGLGVYTGTHLRGKASEQKANKMAYDPLTGEMISIAPGREGWSAWLYGGASAALDYGIEHGGGKLLGALEKKLIGMPMRKLTQRVLGRETAIVMGLAPGVINPSKMGLAARLSSKAQRGFLKVFGSDSWLSGLQKATGIRLLSPSGFLEELNEEITQNSIVGLLNLDGTAVDEQGRLRALSLGNAAKAIVETVKASPEMFGQMALYSLGVGPLTRGAHMLTGAYGSKAALKQGLKALGMTDEQLKGMSRADLKRAFEERLSAQDKGIYQSDLDAIMEELDGKSNAELIGELAKQGWNMTLSEDGQTLEYIDPEQSQKQEAERVEAEAKREETTSDIQLYDEGFAQAQQAKQNTTTIRGEAAIKEHLLGIIEQGLKRDGIRAYHTAKQNYDIGVALTQMTQRELKDVKRHLFNNDLDAAFGFIGNRDVYDTLVESMAIDYLAKSGRYKGTLAERVLRQYAEQLKGQAIVEAKEDGWTRDKADDVRETIAAFNRYFMGNTLEDVDISGEKPARAFTESDNELKAAGQHTTEDGVVFTSTGGGSYTVYYQGNLNDYSVRGITGFSYAMPVFAETMRNEFASYDEALAYANELNAKVKKFKAERAELGKFAQDVARRTLGLNPDEDSGMVFINSVFDDRDIFNEVYGLVLNKMGGDHAKAMQFIGNVRGVKLSDGRTVVFLNNISSRSELVLTIRHELTHKGSNASGLTFRDDWGLSSELVKGLKGAELNKVLKEIFEAAGVPFIGTIGERVQNFDKLDEAEKVRVLDETLAAIAEIIDDKPGLAGRISNRLWGLFSKKTGLKDLTSAQILEEVRNITSDTFARARLDIRQGKKGTRADVRDYAGDIRTAAALGAMAEDEAIDEAEAAKRQQMKATIDELNRQESELRAQEEEAERRRGGRRKRRGRKYETAGETVDGDIDRMSMDEGAVPQQPERSQPETEDAEYDFETTGQGIARRKQEAAMDGGNRYGTMEMPERTFGPERTLADKSDEEKAAEEAERIRLHNRRVDAYVKYLYRHRGEPLPSRYGVIQIFPSDVLALPAPPAQPPPPADPAERLDPKAKKNWNWAEHLAKLAYQQEQEYNRLKKDPHALTEDRLKAANNAFKLYASASMYAEKSGMTEAVKQLNAAFWRMEREIEKNFLEPEARRKANQKAFAKNIKTLQKEFDSVMENAKPRLEDDERSVMWNRLVLDHLMFKAEAAFAKALEKGLRKVGKKQWNAFRGPIINTVRKLANDAASPEGWLAKRLENPSVADADAIKAFIAEAFGLEPDAIPMGWTYMFDEIAKAMEEMTEGVRGYLDWNGPTPTLDLARPTAAGMSMADASHLTEMMRTPAQPREEAQPEEPTPEPTPEPAPEPTPEPTPEPIPTEQVAEQPVAEEQPVEQPQEPAQPKSEWEEREDLDADLEEPFDADETEGAWRPRESGAPGMENANGEVAYDWKEENGLLVAEEDGETISGGRENFQDEADEALGNITESLPAVEGNVVYLQTNSLEGGKVPGKLVVFGESAQAIAGALDAANVTYRDNFDSIDEKMEEGKETRDGDAYDESHYKVTISGKKNVQAAIQALVGDNGDYGAAVLQDEGGSIRIMLNPKSVDMEGVTTLAQAQAANEQLKQGIEERNKQTIEAWEARTGLKYDTEWREHIVRPDGPFREVDGSTIREGTIRNGEWDGEVREYNGDRLTRSVVYKNGVQTGASKEYRFDGTLAVERVPGEGGQSVTEIHYDASGKTENYRLVRGKRGVVLFDSRKQQEQKQEAPAETVAQPATAAKESWEDKPMEAIVQDIRTIRATLRADHTSPLLEPGTVRQKDGTDRTVVYTGGNDGRWTEVRYTRNGELVGESLEFQRLHNDKTASRLDDFLTLTGTTRYDDNGNPVESLGYDPDGRIHRRERFRSWLGEDGDWHVESVDAFVVDEDGIFVYRKGRPTELLPLDALNETRGQPSNTALSVGGRETGPEFNDVRPAEVGRQRRAGAYYPDIGKWIANTAFSIGERRKQEYRAVIAKKRPDLPAADVDTFMGEMDKLGDTKAEKAALHWFVKGGLQLPEDGEKLGTALKTAAKFKLDPFAFGSPDELLAEADRRNPKKQKLAYIDPDTVPELTNKRDLGHGVVVYDVEDSPRGQAAMRRIINSHLGREANGSWKSPWCLLSATDAGEVSTSARKYWRQYNKSGRGAAFYKGRLVAFQSSKKKKPEWWDLKDNSHGESVPIPKGVRKTTTGEIGVSSDKVPADIEIAPAWEILKSGELRPLLPVLGERGSINSGLVEVWNIDIDDTRRVSAKYYTGGELTRETLFAATDGLWRKKGDATHETFYQGNQRIVTNIAGHRSIYTNGEVVKMENLAMDRFNENPFTGEPITHAPPAPGNTALSVGGFGLNANARAEMDKVRKQYEGTDKWMKAPNGKPTKLTKRLWLLVRTPSFKAWFGDWENDPANASKVVDENGEPLVVYHGSENAGFTVFDSDYWDEGMLGNFASSEGFVASTYSGVGIFKGDPDTPLVRGPALNSEDEPDSRPGNYALFLNIRNPLIVDAQGHNWNDIPAEGKDDYVEASDLTDDQLLSLKEDAWPPIDIELEYDEDGNLERWSHLELAEAIEENYVQEELDEDENVIGYSAPLFHKDTLETTTARQLTQSTREISNWALRDGSGWDGVIFRNVIDMGQYSDGGRIRKASDVFVTKDSPQLKSAVRNTGNFSPTSPDIRLSVGERMGGRAPVVEPGGDVREAGEGALAWLRRKFVHSQTPVFDAVRRVMGVGQEPPDRMNVEAAAKNVHGKIRARQEMLQRAYLEPLKAILAQPGIDRKRFDDYALALHALERNRMIQERSVVVDPTTGEVVDLGVEAGSGVTNAWAERVIREVQRDPFAEQYKEAANILAEMNRFVLRGAVADGLLTEAQAKTWMRLSPHYVPLKSGGAAPGAIHKRATGRFTRPDSVLVNSMRQAYATVRNGELNRVNKTMADWIREYDPNGEQVGGTVPESHKHAKIKMTDPQYVPKGSAAEALLRERGIRLVETEDGGGYWVDTGVLPQALKRVVRESVPQGDDIVTFWENGERKFIRFEGKRGRDGRAENEAARIADALNFKNVLHKEGRFWDLIRGATRWKANVSTSWNPTFIVRNMGADVFNTANLMIIEGKYAELARTMRNYPAALRTIARLHSLRREAGDSKMEQMFAEAMQAGAFTGTYGMATFGDFENDINTAIGEFSEMDAKNVLRKGTTQVTRALRKLGNAIDKVGAVPEMGMRLAVYTALRDSGWSKAQAAQYAREITVDFNAKGEWTPFFNTLYMFSNAAIQSFARYMKAFAKTRDEKGTARALGNLSVPIALNILIGYLAASALGDDDDDEKGGLGPDGKAGSTLENLNDYELENNLHIKIGNGVTLRLPTRGTMAPFVYLGQKLAKYQRGLETEEEFLTDVALSMVQANLNFMGQSPTIGQQLAPTVADPLVQWLEGKDWAGRDLFRRDYGQAGSDAHQGFERTPWIYRSAVQALNELTGGDEVQSGAIDWRPESVKLFTDFVLGSISQNIGSIANLADKLGGDETVETGVNDVPFIGGIVRETPDHTSRYYREFDRFDTLRKEMAMYESLAKNARTAEERQAYFAKADAMVAEHPELRFAKGLKRLSDNITDIRKTIREEEARPAEERNQAFIDFLEQQNLELMAEFLRALRR